MHKNNDIPAPFCLNGMFHSAMEWEVEQIKRQLVQPTTQIVHSSVVCPGGGGGSGRLSTPFSSGTTARSVATVYADNRQFVARTNIELTRSIL